MNDLVLTYAGINYWDRTAPLIDGTVKPEGISLRYLTLPPGDLFRRVAQYDEFDAAEMSTSTFVNLLSRGDNRYIAIPVFPSRNFRHSYMFVNSNSGINVPQDLIGKRVGITEYQMTAGLWQRALLKDDYGVRPQDVHWFEGALMKPGRVERNPIPAPPGVSIEHIPETAFLEAMIANGEIDALLGPAAPPAFYDGRVRRLFPNWVEVEQDYYRRTGYFPIMHLVVLRRSVYEANRWIAINLLKAFKRAQEIGWKRVQSTGTLAAMLPWLPRDLEEIRAVMGPDHWAYGFQENEKVLTYMCQQSFEQGMSNRLLQAAELFAEETLAPAGDI